MAIGNYAGRFDIDDVTGLLSEFDAYTGDAERGFSADSHTGWTPADGSFPVSKDEDLDADGSNALIERYSDSVDQVSWPPRVETMWHPDHRTFELNIDIRGKQAGEDAHLHIHWTGHDDWFAEDADDFFTALNRERDAAEDGSIYDAVLATYERAEDQVRVEPALEEQETTPVDYPRPSLPFLIGSDDYAAAVNDLLTDAEEYPVEPPYGRDAAIDPSDVAFGPVFDTAGEWGDHLN